jgi:hypothetical protein
MTEDELIKRINRRLAKDGERLCKARGQQMVHDVGEYYVIDEGNLVLANHVVLEEYARALGVLASEDNLLHELTDAGLIGGRTAANCQTHVCEPFHVIPEEPDRLPLEEFHGVAKVAVLAGRIALAAVARQGTCKRFSWARTILERDKA